MSYEPTIFYHYFSVVFRSRHSQPSQPYYATADLPRFTRMTSAPHCCFLLQRLCVIPDFCVHDPTICSEKPIDVPDPTEGIQSPLDISSRCQESLVATQT
jgi:hypothetical protein